jgi:hypothetical protein
MFPQELLIRKLKGIAPELPRLEWLQEMCDDECFAELRTLSGLDFGSDIEAWESWWTAQKRQEEIDSEDADE